MRNPFRRRPRVTNPPEVIPLVVIGIVAFLVAQLAIGLFVSVVVIAYVLLPGGESIHPGWLLPSAVVFVPAVVLLVLGWKFVRRPIAGWFRRQPPQPLGPAA